MTKATAAATAPVVVATARPSHVQSGSLFGSWTIRVGSRTTSARGSRYMTLDLLEALEAQGKLEILERNVDETGHLVSAKTRGERWVESDRALVQRILGRDLGEKGNLLVFNDEAHHAYRIPPEAEDEDDALLDEEERDEEEENAKEATVWVEGLDRIHKLRKINFCVVDRVYNSEIRCKQKHRGNHNTRRCANLFPTRPGNPPHLGLDLVHPITT